MFHPRVIAATLGLIFVASPLALSTEAIAVSPSTLSIGDATVYEGNLGYTTARVVVTLSDPQATDTFVTYTTVNGTTIGGTPTSTADFVHRTGRVKFKAGKTSAFIAVRMISDSDVEADEELEVLLSNVTPSEVVLADDTATVTVLNDDPDSNALTPTIAIGHSTIYEGDAGVTLARITATLSNPQPTDIFANYSTVDGSASGGDATSGADFLQRQGRIKFKAGKTNATITIKVDGDAAFEIDETFDVHLSAVTSPTVTFLDDIATITIRNDDAAGWTLPEAPLNIRLLGNDAIEWDTPSSDRPIIDYTVENSYDAGINWNPVTTTTALNAATACTACLVRVAATSDVGMGAFAQFDYLTPLPGVPTLLNAVPGPQNRYLTATWSPPTDGSPLMGYDLEVVRGTTVNVLSNVTSPSVFGCGLASVTDTCTMRVRAHNTAGASDWSAPTSASTWAPPDAPPNLTSSGTTVFWDAPASDQPIINYWVFKSVNNGSNWTFVANTTNLQQAATCSICLVRVQAQSSVGFGAFSTISIAFSAPSPPTGLEVTRDVTNPALLHIMWSPPLSASPPIDTYDVSINDFTFPLTVPGLTTTTLDYHMRTPVAVLVSVVARNAAGISPPTTLFVPAG